MKKLLLIGGLNQIMAMLNKHLSTRFQTQMCMDNFEMVKGMDKVFRPDMFVISLIGIGEMDAAILDYISEKTSGVPVLFVGTAEECAYYQKRYKEDRYDYAIRPTTLGILLRKCQDMLSIPAYKSEAEAQQEVQTRKSILAVDDSGIFLRSIKAMLKDKYDVSVANSGENALVQARKKMPNLILLDYEMPGWDGKKTLEEIRNDEAFKDVPVVFLTAIADKAHIAAVLELKPSGYLLKPIDQQRLFETIEEALIKI